MAPVSLFQVDAFCEGPFTGNPAAVVPLERWPEDRLLQAVAAENNLSETAFLVAEGEGYRLRWFTPVTEVALCGHATLAAGWVVLERLRPAADEVTFFTRSGPLTVAREAEGAGWRMDFPALTPAPCDAPPGLAAALGVEPRETLVAGERDLLAVLGTEGEVCGLRPDMAALEALERPGIIVTAPGETADFVSRFFAPALGVPEDPVTGSAHCALAPYWAERSGRGRLVGRQLSRRGGTVRCRLEGERVELAGRCRLFLEGRALLPARWKPPG